MGFLLLTGVACTLSYFQDVLGIISCMFDLTNDDLLLRISASIYCIAPLINMLYDAHNKLFVSINVLLL